MRAACEALRRVVDSLPDHKVIWTAFDGVEAIAMAKRDRPDLILMDLIMPHVDGAQATRQIMAAAPCAILVVTATVSGNISLVYEAMGHGALDAVDTPMLGPTGEVSGAGALVDKIGMIAIQKLRDEAQAELGDKFDWKAFHDTVITGGSLPLPVLETRVRTWIAKVKAG
jgi:two-component system response regulator WspF